LDRINKILRIKTKLIVFAFLMSVAMVSQRLTGEVSGHNPVNPVRKLQNEDSMVKKVSEPGKYTGYSEKQYDGYVVTSRYIEVRDGTKLAADIYRPAIDGKPVDKPFPVIFQHSMGRGMQRPDGAIMRGHMLRGVLELVTYGYVVAEIDRRGMGASFGTRRGYHDMTENKDAYDITEWLAAQPWSDGNIGVVGCSNMGEAAVHVAIEMPPHLKAIFAGCYNWNKYDGFLRGGIRANWGAGPDRTSEQDLQSAPVDDDTDKSLLREAVGAHRGNTSLRDLWRSMPYRDSHSELTNSKFWMEGSVSTYRESIEKGGAAMYTYGGWFDDFRTQGLVTLKNLSNPGKILIGPWQHCGTDHFDIASERLRFFDYWLKGVDNGIMKEPPVYYYTMNAREGKEWRFASRWPLPGEQRKNLIFTNGTSGTVSSVNDGVLMIADKDEVPPDPGKKEDREKDKYTTDYTVSNPPNWPMLAQTSVLDEKGLTYTSAPLRSDMEMTGCPVAHIWMSSTAADANIFVYLEDVDPDGNVEIITDGRLRASLRKSNSPPYDYLGLPWHRSNEKDAEALISGDPVELVFDLLATSWNVKARHRIRVTLTAADPREFERKEMSPPPEITIYRNQQHRSYVDMPVIP